MNKRKMIYIMSPSYSGSTLLTRLLAAYPQIGTIGELKAPELPDLQNYLCSCGDRLVKCEFWERVRNELRKREMDLDFSNWGTGFRSDKWLTNRVMRPMIHGAQLESLRSRALGWPGIQTEFEKILQKNLAIIDIVLDLQSAQIFLDDSKDPSRALYFLDSGEFDMKIICLVRDGRGTVNSDCRHNNISIAKATRDWVAKIEEMRRLEMMLESEQLLHVSYETLCTDTDYVMSQIETFAGLQPATSDQDINAKQHILGNSMRLQKIENIALDEKWRKSLDAASLESFYAIGGEVNQSLGYLRAAPKTSARAAEVKGQLRPIVQKVLSGIGVFNRSIEKLKNTVPVLTVHGVVNAGENEHWHPTWARCPQDRLDQVLTVLGAHFRFISVDEAAAMLRGDVPFQPGSMAITFDDGYKNNIDLALPVLRKHGAPLNIFVATGPSANRQPFWIDRLDFALQKLEAPSYQIKTDRIRYDIDLTSYDSFFQTFTGFRTSVMDVYSDDYELSADLDLIAADIEARSGFSLMNIFEDDQFSSTIHPSDMKAFGDDVIIGSHTVNHVRAGFVAAAQLREELVSSKAKIESWRGKPCKHFCFPNGDFDEESIELVKSCGYESAFIGVDGTNQVGDDLFRLKRVSFPHASSETEVFYHLFRNL